MKKIAIVFILYSLADAALLPDTCKQDTWVTESDVSTVFSSGKTAYIGIGSSNLIGPYTGGFVPFTLGDHNQHVIAPSFPKVNGTVWAICPDGSGGWFIGGLFILVDGVPRNNLAHILSNLTVDPSWNTGTDSLVASLALNGTTLVVGGRFGRVGNESRSKIASVDVQTGAVTGWNPGSDKFVQCLAISGTTIFAGGTFSTMGGKARSSLAALNASSDTALSWVSDVHGVVYALAVYGTNLYVGGSFDTIKGTGRKNIAALSTVTGDTIPAFYTWADSAIYAIVIHGTDMYVGGRFSNIRGQAVNRVAKLYPTTGVVDLDIQLAINKPVYAIAVSDVSIFIGGPFTSVGGQEMNYIAQINISSGAAGGWDPKVSDTVRTLVTNSGKLYIGGAFRSTGCERRSGIVALDATTGKPTGFTTSISGTVNAMAKLGTTLYICGTFTSVGGQNRKYLAALDAVTGSLLGWNPNPNAYVNAIALNGTMVYAGGEFDTIGGKKRSKIAAFDAATGNLTDWDPAANWRVGAIAVRGKTVYVGGGLDNIGGKARNNIAALDSATGLALDWNPNANKPLFGLVVNGTTVYALGEFDTVAGQRRNSLAAIDAQTGALLPWDPLPNKRVRCLAVMGGVIHAGGYFDTIGGQARKIAAALDRTTGATLPWQPDVYGSYPSVWSISASGGTLFAAGYFSSLGRTIGHPQLAQFGEYRAAPEITSLAPPSGIDSGATTTTLQGVGFGSNPLVQFVKAGQTDLVALVTSASATNIACKVNIKDAAAGAWDVIVTNDDTQADTLFAGFTVTPSAPALVFPSNNAAGVALTPTLLWGKTPNDSMYTLQLSASPDFSLRIINNGSITDTFYSIGQSLANNTTYYWKVASLKKGGIATAFCSAWNFTTVSLPGQVSLLSPSDYAYLQTDSVVFRWSKPSVGGDKFCVEVFTDSLLNGRMLLDSTITDTTYVLRGLQNKKSYWWRVSAHNSLGWGTASNARKFTINVPTSTLPNKFMCIVNSLSKSGSSIRYGLPGVSDVSIRFYSVSGKLLKSVDFPKQRAGYHRYSIAAHEFSTGYFMVDFRAGNFKRTQKLSNF
jgi:trimeric autotransporter adhesin